MVSRHAVLIGASHLHSDAILGEEIYDIFTLRGVRQVADIQSWALLVTHSV